MTADTANGWSWPRRLGLIIGFLLFIVLATGLVGQGLDPRARLTAAVVTLTAIWWVTEALPIPVTSLLPIILFPALGVMPSDAVIANYANSNIDLFLGGFLIALALERSGLHRRMALWMLFRVGARPRGLVLGFLASTAFLSMWMSNTATAMLMLPIGLAVTSAALEKSEGDSRDFASAVMLAIAYGASVGGLATPIGTPPNLVFLGQFARAFPKAPTITFLDWIKVFAPFSAVFILVIWVILTRIKFRRMPEALIDAATVSEQRAALGPWTTSERAVATVFTITALLWVFRADINLGSWRIPGWSNLFPHPEMLHDATVAITMAFLLFLLPDGRGARCMDWKTAMRLPWGILLLFGGGFAIADAFTQTGLDRAIGTALKPVVGGFGPFWIMLAVCLLMIFLTELASNTAAAAAMLPVMIGLALSARINPLFLMVPATIAASCGFMLPVGTPPNAIVFSSGQISMASMAKTGLIVNLSAALLLSLYLYWVLGPLWGVGLELPVWAE